MRISPTTAKTSMSAGSARTIPPRSVPAPRKQIDTDDRVTINIDTFQDHKHAYWFDVNPYGIQYDGRQPHSLRLWPVDGHHPHLRPRETVAELVRRPNFHSHSAKTDPGSAELSAGLRTLFRHRFSG